MNTDEILDMIVEYRLWFIIGGAIILFAIVGFISDRKKVLPGRKNKKVKKEKNLKSSVSEASKDGFSNEKAAEMNLEKEDFWGNNPNKDDKKEPIIENINETKEESLKPENIELSVNDTDVKDLNEDLLVEEKNSNVTLSEHSEPENQNTIGWSNVAENEEKDNSSANNLFDEEKVLDVVNDINKINQMEMVDEERNEDFIQKPLPEKENIHEKVINNNLEDTMQVSYSQLKEMVEDIIAENLEETKNDVSKSEEKGSESQIIQNEGSVADVPLPNLDNIDIDSINRQNEDEDDVWKF